MMINGFHLRAPTLKSKKWLTKLIRLCKIGGSSEYLRISEPPENPE